MRIGPSDERPVQIIHEPTSGILEDPKKTGKKKQNFFEWDILKTNGDITYGGFVRFSRS